MQVNTLRRLHAVILLQYKAEVSFIYAILTWLINLSLSLVVGQTYQLLYIGKTRC